MKTPKIIIALGAAVFLQCLVLGGMVAKASLPLWAGKEIRIKTIPYDPRSMLRGNYARLNYEISTLPETAFPKDMRLRRGEIVYVMLQQANNGLYVYKGAALEKPKQGIYLQGRITNGYAPYRVKYGIEAFFAPKEEALQLQSDLVNGGAAVLMVTSAGDVALKAIEPNPAPATNMSD